MDFIKKVLHSQQNLIAKIFLITNKKIYKSFRNCNFNRFNNLNTNIAFFLKFKMKFSLNILQ